MSCSQCGERLRGYFQFKVCSDCYRKNVDAEQRKKLAEERKEAK